MKERVEDRSAERMLERYHQGLLTERELDDFLEIQRHRSQLQEQAIQAGREPMEPRENDG